MPLTRLAFTNVGPFRDVEFEFDKRVNVFLGPNNSGKSATLLVLGEIAVYPFTIPRKLLRGTRSDWSVLVEADSVRRRFHGKLPISLSSKTFKGEDCIFASSSRIFHVHTGNPIQLRL